MERLGVKKVDKASDGEWVISRFQRFLTKPVFVHERK